MYSRKQIISLSSVGSGVGKDSVADILVKYHGFTQFSWASELRREVAKSFRESVGDSIEVPQNYLENTPHIIPNKFWEASSGFCSALRSYENKRKIFIRNQQYLQTIIPGSKLVVSDTRFPCEVEFMRSQDAELVLVEGVARRGVFEFDNLLSRVIWDYKLDNYGELSELIERVEVMMFSI